MRNKRGFTLIELLAVIVILAVIALIATPIIMNVINDSKEGAAKDSMYGYIKAVELASIDAVTVLTDAPAGKYVPENGNLKQGSEVLEVAFKGTKPKDNTGEVILSKGNVAEATLEFDGITVHYDGKKAEIGGSSASTPTPTSTATPIPEIALSAGDAIYYNPVSNKKCTSSEVVSTTGTKTGCMKWNVITKNDTKQAKTVNVLLDHNISTGIKWTSSTSSSDMVELSAALTSDTEGWTSGLNPRLITGEELSGLVNDSSWTSTGTSISLSAASWLYQNNETGYWTGTLKAPTVRAWSMYEAWFVDGSGFLNTTAVDLSLGVRPVITIQKNIIA